jgi:hypothetical protein
MSGKENRNQKKQFYTLALLGALYFLLRIFFLWHAGDFLYLGEESFIGSITQEVIRGLNMASILDYQMTPYWGGSIVTAILAVPLFRIVGAYILSLKLIPILINLLGLVFMFLIADRYLDRRIAFFSAIFAIFPAPFFTAMSLSACGSHPEAGSLSMIILFIFYSIIFNQPSRTHYLLLGLLSGFFLWYDYICGITIIGYLIFWFLKDKDFFLKKGFILYLIFFVIGCLPWISYNLKYEFSGLDIIRQGFTPFKVDFIAGSFAKFSKFIISDAKELYLWKKFYFIPGGVFNYIYHGYVLAAFILLIYSAIKLIFNRWDFVNWRIALLKGQEIRLSILIIVILFILLYSFSNFNWGSVREGGANKFRYFAYLAPFIYLALAMFVSACFDSKRYRGLGYLSLSSLVVIGLIGNFTTQKTNYAHNDFLFRQGYDYRHFGRMAYRNPDTHNSNINKLFEKLFNSKEISDAYEGYAEAFILSRKNIADCLVFSEKIINKNFKGKYFIGLGRGIRQYSGDIQYCVNEASKLEYDMRRYFILGCLLETPLYEKATLLDYKVNILPVLKNTDYFNLALFIYGGGLYKCLDYNIAAALEEIRSFDNNSQRFCIMGVGFDIAMSSQNMENIALMCNQFPIEMRPLLYKGISYYFYWANHNSLDGIDIF